MTNGSITTERMSLAAAEPLWRRLAGDRVFAGPAFAGLWEAKGGTPVVWTARRGGEVVAALPGVEFGRFGFLRRFMSMPDGCYGGVLRDPDHPADPDADRALLDAVLQAGYARTFVFDFDGDLPADPRFTTMDLETTLVDISAPDWMPPDRKLVSQVRKAEREGITVGRMDWDRCGDRFLALARDTAARHGQQLLHGRRFYARLADLARRDPRVHWVWCEFRGEAACSHIYVVERGILQGWQIHFDKRFSFLKPNQYIRFHTCREMAAGGVRYLNLGGSPENAPGLRSYKRRWGGEKVAYRGLVHRRGLGRFTLSGRR